MLARGLLCRLAAASSTSTSTSSTTHDLAPLARAHAHALQRSLLARNGSSAALLRAVRTAIAGHSRAYATATTARTKPTAKVVKDVKKSAAAAKKPATKAKAKAKAAPAAKKKKPVKKKVAAKKKAAKPKKKKKIVKPKKPARKVLTPEQKGRAAAKKRAEENRALKQIALKEPSSGGSISALNAFLRDKLTKADGNTVKALTELAPTFKSLSPAEREHYNHLASEMTAKSKAEYDAWVRTYTPLQIRDANRARSLLRRRGVRGYVRAKNIKDDRAPRATANAYALFFKHRQASGDFKGIVAAERAKLIGVEWKALSAAEKKPFEDQSKESSIQYIKEHQKVYGKPAGIAKANSSAA